MIQAYQWAVTHQKLIGQYEAKIARLENGNDKLHKYSNKCKEFIEAEGLGVKFDVFLHPKSIRSKLREKKEEVKIREAQKAKDGIVDYKRRKNQMEI